jgi:hypothetical protein
MPGQPPPAQPAVGCTGQLCGTPPKLPPPLHDSFRPCSVLTLSLSLNKGAAIAKTVKLEAFRQAVSVQIGIRNPVLLINKIRDWSSDSLLPNQEKALGVLALPVVKFPTTSGTVKRRYGPVMVEHAH